MTPAAPLPSDPGPLDDTLSLIARHRAGDQAALQRLMRRCYDRVRRMVRVRMGRFLRAREEVDDVVQDVLVRVIDGVDRFEPRPGASFNDWLARLVERELANHSRRERAKKRGGGLAEQVQLHAESVTSFDIPADSTGVATRAETRELAERVDACVAQLSEAHREVVLLRRYADADWETVAAAMGRRPEACQELYRRAIVALSKLMGEGGNAGSVSG